MISSLSLKDSNQFIIDKLLLNEPFVISRIGLGSETHVSYEYLITGKLSRFETLNNNAGIYWNNQDDILQYCIKYTQAIANSQALAVFRDACQIEQTFFVTKYQLTKLYSRVLEPFYCILENIKPWSHYLLGKKVLIIHPFVESFKKQMKNEFKIFKSNDNIFLIGQEFVYYKCYQTSAGNHPHKNWLETFGIMCQEIKQLNFDIALLGCGGYGLPLCDFIKSDLKKSAIYIGGGLQLMFGVMGKRWDNHSMWKKIIAENDCHFIRPSDDEILINHNQVENGCYW